MLDQVINSGEDEDVEPATDEEALVMAERLNDRRVLLAAFLKLATFQVIDAKMAAPVWGYFITVSRSDSHPLPLFVIAGEKCLFFFFFLFFFF